MPNMWDEKPLKTYIKIELEQNRCTVNFSRFRNCGMTCFRITPTFIQDIVGMLKNEITGKEFLHQLALNIKSPHDQLIEYYKIITLEEVHKALESSITDFLTKEVNNMNEIALKAEQEKNSRYCSIM